MFWAAAGTAVRSIVRTIDVMVVMIVFMTFCFSLLQRSPLQPARARHKSVYVLSVSDFDTFVCIPLSKSVTEIRLKILDFVQHIMKMSIFVIK